MSTSPTTAIITSWARRLRATRLGTLWLRDTTRCERLLPNAITFRQTPSSTVTRSWEARATGPHFAENIEKQWASTWQLFARLEIVECATCSAGSTSAVYTLGMRIHTNRTILSSVTSSNESMSTQRRPTRLSRRSLWQIRSRLKKTTRHSSSAISKTAQLGTGPASSNAFPPRSTSPTHAKRPAFRQRTSPFTYTVDAAPCAKSIPKHGARWLASST